jgi:CRISPR-associated endonuclease Cas1 subtype II
MSWRVVVVSKRCKLESRLGYLVCRGEETARVYIPEISTLIVESTAVSLTAALLGDLTDNKVNVVFCDGKHNPQSQLIPFYGRYDGSGKLARQIGWRQEAKAAVWTEIIKNKILQQYNFLAELGSDRAEMLADFTEGIETGDPSNREGHAAKVYFNTLFGMDFKRGDETFTNAALNYGYAIILSAFNREIVSDGYSTQLGLCHRNEFNSFNLACDLMEPFRILVDRCVFSNIFCENMTEYKRILQNLLNREVKIDGQNRTASDAVAVYCRSVFDALESGDETKILFYTVK